MKTFQHFGNLGDIIYSLPTIIALGGGILYIGIRTDNLEISIKAPAPNPMSKKMALQIIELLKTQPYLKDIRLYNNERIDYNLNKFREHHAVMNNHIAKSHLDTFGVNYNLALPWMQNITPIYINDIVISRSKRNLSTLNKFNWGVLSKYEEKCVFIGFEDEYEEFKKFTGLNIKRYSVRSTLEIARVVKGSRLFIGNQSLGFALAEAMKHPRVLEVYYSAPNCIPQSINGYLKLSEKIIKSILNEKQKIFLLPKFDNLLAHSRNFLYVLIMKLRKKLFSKIDRKR